MSNNMRIIRMNVQNQYLACRTIQTYANIWNTSWQRIWSKNCDKRVKSDSGISIIVWANCSPIGQGCRPNNCHKSVSLCRFYVLFGANPIYAESGIDCGRFHSFIQSNRGDMFIWMSSDRKSLLFFTFQTANSKNRAWVGPILAVLVANRKSLSTATRWYIIRRGSVESLPPPDNLKRASLQITWKDQVPANPTFWQTSIYKNLWTAMRSHSFTCTITWYEKSKRIKIDSKLRLQKECRNRSKMKNCWEKKMAKRTTPGIPTWSPTVVLTRPDDA
jgi:hypothetical protein